MLNVLHLAGSPGLRDTRPARRVPARALALILLEADASLGPEVAGRDRLAVPLTRIPGTHPQETMGLQGLRSGGPG